MWSFLLMLKWEETKKCYLLYTERVMSFVNEKVKEWLWVRQWEVQGNGKWTPVLKKIPGAVSSVLYYCFALLLLLWLTVYANC
jgi:5-enolpyruvylshikimate-3-phosphate synthase